MVRSLHHAGIEVILDVVYNHTGEGSHLGPILSFKGIDNAYYYRLAEDPRYYMDYTGCGNSLNMRHPHALQLLMDSLRYWVLEMHVDGFRFDLASTLARELHDVDRLSSFFDIIQQDPVINQVKLIAEPWDVGEGGYQVGNFPPLWTEWNGKYRDCIRDFWAGREQSMGEFAYRLTGSPDLNEISWYDWENVDPSLLEFTRGLIHFRREHPVFRRRRWFIGRRIYGSEVKDIIWITPDGRQMGEENWEQGHFSSLGVFLNGETIPNPNPRGEPVTDESFYLMFNGHHEPVDFTVVGDRWEARWCIVIDTAEGGFLETERLLSAKETLTLAPYASVVLKLVGATAQQE